MQGKLIKLASLMIQNGMTRDDVYKEFLHFYEKSKMDDSLEDEIVDVLNILSGSHNPYVVVDSNGINVKKL